MPKTRWPNLDIDQPYEMHVELEHVMAFMAQNWRQRTGHAGTRSPLLQPRHVRITAGVLEKKLEMGGDQKKGGLASLVRSGTPAQSRLTGAKLRASQVESRASLNSDGEPLAHDGKRPIVPQLGVAPLQVFCCPDFVLIESPVLFDMYKAVAPTRPDKGHTGPLEMGPISSHQEIFNGVVILLKLRWLVRLQSAVVAMGGSRCSLQRYLKGVLADCSGAHLFPHLPIPYFDAVTENLHGHLGQAYPLFIAHINQHNHERPQQSSQAQVGTGTQGSLPEMPGDARSIANANSTAAVAQLVDDIFVTWVAQQNSDQMSVELLMQELDYFQIRRPTLRVNMEGLYGWSVARSQTRYRYTRAAQLDATHLALVLDMPPLWNSWQHSRDDVLEMARNIVAHPRTFNMGVRARVANILTDEVLHTDTTSGAICPSFNHTVSKEQMSLVHSFLASPRDEGRLNPSIIEKCHESSPPWLIGRETRFANTSNFHTRMAREATPGGRTLPPLEAGTPRMGY